MYLKDLPQWATATFAGFLTVGTVLGTFLNATFIAIYYIHKHIRTRSTQLFAILATSDLLVSLTVGPLHIIPLLYDQAAASPWYHKIRIFITATTISMSVYTIVIIAIERMLTVRQIENTKYSTKQLAIITTALITAATSTPACRLIPGDAAYVIYLALATCTAISSIGGVSTSYCILVHIVHKHLRLPGMPNKERKTTNIARRLTLTYIVSLTPMILYHILRLTGHLPDSSLTTLYATALVTILSTCCTNPMLYYISNNTILTTYKSTSRLARQQEERRRSAQLIRQKDTAPSLLF